MARMLGRHRRAGCGKGACSRCSNGDETRWMKRVEQRQVQREIEAESNPLPIGNSSIGHGRSST